MGMGVIQAASQGAFNANPYVSQGLTNSFTQPPANPYTPAGAGYSNVNSPSPAAGGSMEGRYEIKKMANGGLAAAAQNMAGQGRNGDSMLVHMTPGEVKGLQAIAMAHGGSLSINPNTGLPEASFLKNLLPTIAGIGLNMMFPGSGALIGLGVGGATALATGDINKGLMAGLGAYGGAGIGEGLSKVGAASLGETALPQATSIPGAAPIGTEAGAAVRNFTPIPGAAEVVPNTAADTLKASIQPQPSFSNMGAGIKAAFQPGGASALYNALPTGTLPALAGTALSAMTPEAPKPPGKEEEDPRYKGSPYRYNLASNFGGYTPAQPNPYYRPTGLGYAEGGDIMMAAGGSYDDEPRGDDGGFGFASGGIAGYAMGGLKMGEGIARDTDDDTASLNAFEAAKKRVAKINKAANMPKKYAAQMPQVRGLGELSMAQGGSLGGYSDGGRMLKGPGDGMSDSIPANIGGKQPARLADGEFVVPADVVSHLGNGSTDAGAKKLYGMMDKVRKARTGKKKQAPAVKADKYMPA